MLLNQASGPKLIEGLFQLLLISISLAEALQFSLHLIDNLELLINVRESLRLRELGFFDLSLGPPALGASLHKVVANSFANYNLMDDVG